MTRLLTVVVLAVVFGCGGRAHAPTRHHPDDAGRPPDHHDHEGSNDVVVAPADNGHPTEPACLAMIDHVVDIDVAERPADQHPTAADLADTRKDLHDTLLPKCREELTHEQVACLTTAPSTTAMAACIDPKD